jgi:hypothetical protein
MIEKAMAVAGPKSTKELTEKEKKIQDLFDSNPFDCQVANAAKLVGILTGFTPKLGATGSVLPMFTVYYNKNKPDLKFIILAAQGGQCWGCCGTNLKSDAFSLYEPNGCALCSQYDSEKFLKEVVANWRDRDVLVWVATRLGSGHLPTFLDELGCC